MVTKKTTTREIKQGKSAPVVETVTEIIEDIKEEANETAGTITVKRWQVLAVAAAFTLALLIIVL